MVAQLVEHLPFKERVLGSSPSQVTKVLHYNSTFFVLEYQFTQNCPGAGIGRQAWLRAMCPLGRMGSTPILGTKKEMCLYETHLFFYFQLQE